MLCRRVQVESRDWLQRSRELDLIQLTREGVLALSGDDVDVVKMKQSCTM